MKEFVQETLFKKLGNHQFIVDMHLLVDSLQKDIKQNP